MTSSKGFDEVSTSICPFPLLYLYFLPLLSTKAAPLFFRTNRNLKLLSLFLLPFQQWKTMPKLQSFQSQFQPHFLTPHLLLLHLLLNIHQVFLPLTLNLLLTILINSLHHHHQLLLLRLFSALVPPAKSFAAAASRSVF